MERALERAIGDARIDDPDADVLQLIDAGETRRAVELLMRRHGKRIYRYCRAALRDAALADDVHQQTFIAAMRDLGRFRRQAKLGVWLLSIAHHRVLDAAKARGRADTRLVSGSDDLVSSALAPNDALDDLHLQQRLMDCVHRLDPPSRSAVLMRYQQGLSFDEMAALCDEKAGTLQARVNRALPRLRTMLSRRATAARRSRR